MGLERAVAVAQQHADLVAAVVGGDDVGDAVAVQIRHGHRDRAAPVANVSFVWNEPSALPSSTLTLLSEPVGGDDVGHAVAVRSATTTWNGARWVRAADCCVPNVKCRRRCPAARSPCRRPGWR